jgi:hypothetical protein
MLVPVPASLDVGAALLFAVACITLFAAKQGIFRTLALCATLGLVWHWIA